MAVTHAGASLSTQHMVLSRTYAIKERGLSGENELSLE